MHEKFQLTPSCLWDTKCFFFRNSPLDCLSKTYFTLGQLTALSIMKIGRGPECLNDIIVLKLFEQDLPEPLPATCFQEFKNSINQINNTNYDILLDLNIIPVKDNAANKRRFIVTRTLIEPASRIQKFKNLSIPSTMLNPSNYSVMKDYSLHRRTHRHSKYFEVVHI